MSSRHRKDDSLDLLLDTVCNAFGGLILIALLVALLVQSSYQQEVDDRSSGNDTNRQAEQASLELVQLQRRQEQLRRQQRPDSHQQQIEHEHNRRALEAARERVALLRSASTVQADSLIEGFEQLSENLNSQLAAVKSRIDELHETIALRQAKIDELKDQQITFVAKIEEEHESRQIRVSLPRERGVVGNSIQIVVHHGLVYFLHSDHMQGVRITELSDTDIQVDTTPGAGLHPVRDRAQIARILGQSYNGVEIMMYSDSFHLYYDIKEMIAEMRLAWAWDPMTTEFPLVLTSGQGHRAAAQQ